MKFVLKENFLRDGIEAWVNNFKGISEDLWVCVSPCYYPPKSKDDNELKYYCHLLYVAKGAKDSTNRIALKMRDGNIIKGVKPDKWDERGPWTGETIGTYIAINDFYNISIDLDKVEDML